MEHAGNSAFICCKVGQSRFLVSVLGPIPTSGHYGTVSSVGMVRHVGSNWHAIFFVLIVLGFIKYF